MKQLKIILIIFFSFFFDFYWSQETLDSLVYFERKTFEETNPINQNNWKLSKFNYQLKQNYPDSILFLQVNRINIDIINDVTLKTTFAWNASILCFINNDFQTASYFHDKYKMFSSDTNTIHSNFLGFITSKNYPELQRSYFEKLKTLDSNFSQLTCYLALNNEELLDQRFVKQSKIFPGLGLFKMGEKKRGLVSFFSTSLFTASAVFLGFKGLYFNAIEIGYVFALRFYQGSVILTQQRVNIQDKLQKNRLTSECEPIFKNLLEKYPILFRRN